jgi:hypothetical protein
MPEKALLRPLRLLQAISAPIDARVQVANIHEEVFIEMPPGMPYALTLSPFMGVAGAGTCFGGTATECAKPARRIYSAMTNPLRSRAG